MREEGVEILTSSRRFLSDGEAFYLRSRIVGQSERRLARTLAQDFSKPSAESEIKRKGEIDTLNMGDLGQNDPYLMERLSRIKEFHMKKMRQTFKGTSAKNQQQSNSEPQKGRRQANSIPTDRRGIENRSGVGNDADGGLGFDLNATINQRVDFD